MSNNQTSDSVFEALFRQAVIDNYIEEINSIPLNEELSKLYTFSPKFELRMKKLFAKKERKDNFIVIVKYTKRAAAIFLIGTTVLFAALLSKPEVRAAVKKVIVEWYEQFTSFTFTDEISLENEMRTLRPKYLPVGYFEDSVETLNSATYVMYTNDLDEEIRFSYRASDNTTNFSVDNENHIIEECTINGNIAFTATALNSDFENGIFYSDNGFAIGIWSKLPVDELIKIAESIFIQE